MDTTTQALGDTGRRLLDHELTIVTDGIAFVASGGAVRVTVASLQFGQYLVDAALRLGRESGVRVTPIWSLGDRVSLAIERLANE